VWRALWEERKRRQKAVKQREESGTKQWWNAAAAPNLLELRLVDAVLYEPNNSKPSHGLFTAKTGELMRRAAASLEPSVVQARMAQVALGVFGGGAAATAAAAAAALGDSGSSTPAIAVAYLADGSVRELRGGAAWDQFVGASTRTGLLRAITPFAAPLCTPSNGKSGSSSNSGASIVRLRNVYRLATEGSQIGKVQTNSQRVVLRGTGATKSVYGAAAAKSSATNAPKSSATHAPGGVGSADALVLVPSRADALHRRLDAATLQVVKLIEASCLAGAVSATRGQDSSGGSTAASQAPRRARVRRFVADYVVQPPLSSTQATADVGEHADRRATHGGGSGQKRQNGSGDGDHSGGGSERNRGKSEGLGEAVVWFERCVELELEEAPPSDNAPSGSQASTGNGTMTSVNSPNSASVVAPAALPRLVKNNGNSGGTGHSTAGGASSGVRSCCGDFCAFDTLQELSVMEGDSSAFSMGSPPRRADKVVAFRSVSAARQDAAQILRRVAAHFVPGGGRGGLGGGLGGGGDTECTIELREGLEDQGWPSALAHWWLRARAGLPIGPTAAAAAAAAVVPTKASSTGTASGRSSVVVGNAPSPPPGKPPLNYHEPKRLLCTSPSDIPPEVWWPGRLVEVCWASSGPLAFVSVWLQDEAGFCVAVAPRAPNSGRLVCVIPATLTSRLAASRGVTTRTSASDASTPPLGDANRRGGAAAAGGKGKGGTNGWVFKVRVCDVRDPAVECWSAPVIVVASEKDVLPEDKVRKPHEQLEFEERVRRRRVEEWRASHVASDAAAAASARSPPRRQPQLPSSGMASPASSGIANGATSLSVVGALRALKLGETDVLGPSGSAAMVVGGGGGGGASTNGLAHLPLHQLYKEVKVCSTCYGVYKELDQARRVTEERDARDAKKHALRQKLVKEQV